MDINNLITQIDSALIEAQNVVNKSKFLTPNSPAISSLTKVLNLLKESVLENPDRINERILRAMHDIGMSSYKDFENTPLETAIDEVIRVLYYEIPNYKFLTPLRDDFGKGDPV